MIYNFGVHLEHKAGETLSSPLPVEAFPAGDSQIDLVRLFTDQSASLTDTINHKRRGRVNRNNTDRF